MRKKTVYTSIIRDKDNNIIHSKTFNNRKKAGMFFDLVDYDYLTCKLTIETNIKNEVEFNVYTNVTTIETIE